MRARGLRTRRPDAGPHPRQQPECSPSGRVSAASASSQSPARVSIRNERQPADAPHQQSEERRLERHRRTRTPGVSRPPAASDHEVTAPVRRSRRSSCTPTSEQTTEERDRASRRARDPQPALPPASCLQDQPQEVAVTLQAIPTAPADLATRSRQLDRVGGRDVAVIDRTRPEASGEVGRAVRRPARSGPNGSARPASQGMVVCDGRCTRIATETGALPYAAAWPAEEKILDLDRARVARAHANAVDRILKPTICSTSRCTFGLSTPQLVVELEQQTRGPHTASFEANAVHPPESPDAGRGAARVAWPARPGSSRADPRGSTYLRAAARFREDSHSRLCAGLPDLERRRSRGSFTALAGSAAARLAEGFRKARATGPRRSASFRSAAARPGTGTPIRICPSTQSCARSRTSRYSSAGISC